MPNICLEEHLVVFVRISLNCPMNMHEHTSFLNWETLIRMIVFHELYCFNQALVAIVFQNGLSS